MSNFFMTRRHFSVGLVSLVSGSLTRTSVLAEQGVAGDPSFLPLPLKSLQSFAYDRQSNLLYTQFVQRRGSVEFSSIWRFAIEGRRARLIDKQLPSYLLGHQSLALGAVEEKAKLWMPSPGESRSAIRFTYCPDDQPQDIEVFTLFDDRFDAVGVSLAISDDKKWLVAASRIPTDRGHQKVVRVFDFDDVSRVRAGGDCKHIFEWNLPTKKGLPLQGLACEGGRVWSCFGTSAIGEEKPLFVHSLQGELLAKLDDLEVGRLDAMRLPNVTNYEPEGLAVILHNDHKSMAVGISMGARAQKKIALYWLDALGLPF